MLRYGIMGPGRIAGKFADACKEVPGVEVVAVSSKSLERAQAFASSHAVKYAFGSYAEMLSGDLVDAVYIATTHNFHRELIEMALKSGKHVICEKAMVLHRSDAEYLFALAREKGLFLMEATWTCFLPQVQAARKWIEAGRIGTPELVSAVIGFDCGGDLNDRLLNPKLAGGTLYDIGVYPIEIITYLLGQPIRSVMGTIRRHRVSGVDEKSSMILSYPDCEASVQCIFTGNPKEYVIINGSDGFIELPTAHIGREALLFNKQRQLVDRVYSDYDNGFVYEIAHMRDAIAAGKIESDVLPARLTEEAAGVYDTLLNTWNM